MLIEPLEKKNFCRLLTWWVNSLVVIILVHGSVSWPGLGSSGPLGHDDLIDPEDGAGRIGGVTHGPVLQEQEVVDLPLCCVDGQAGALNVGVILQRNENIF